MASKTKLIGTATTLTITSILIWIAFNQNFILTASGNIKCTGSPKYSELFKGDISDCQVFWNVTSKDYTYYFRNKNGIKLNFTPEVKDYKWFVKDGRYKSGYRQLDKFGNFTFTKGKKYEFMAFIFKEPTKTVKWSITAAEQKIDPILYGLDVADICDNIILTTEIKIPIYKDVVHEYTCDEVQTIDSKTKHAICYTNVQNINGTRSIIFEHDYDTIELNKIIWTQSDQIGSYIDYQNKTICRKKGLQIEDKTIDFEKCGISCSMDGSIVQCDSCDDGNCDGILQSGESGIYPIDISDLNWKGKLSENKRGDTPNIIKRLRECIN